MEPLAVNIFTITKSLFYEGMLQVIGKRYFPFAKKVLLVLAALWAALAAVTLFMRGNSPIPVLIELLVVVLIGVWLWVYIPATRARRAWKALEDKCGGDLERVTRFYPDYMEVDSGGETTDVYYEDVRQLLMTDHLLVLICEDRVGVLLARDGFTSGDADLVCSLVKKHNALLQQDEERI